MFVHLVFVCGSLSLCYTTEKLACSQILESPHLNVMYIVSMKIVSECVPCTSTAVH